MNFLEKIKKLEEGIIIRNYIIVALAMIAIALFITSLNEMNTISSMAGI